MDHTACNIRRRAQIWIIAALGTALSISGSAIVSGLENQTSAAEFNLRASNTAAALQNGVTQYLTKISALRALFEALPMAVSQQEFLTFSNRLLKDEPAILSLSWAPRILNENRAAHELEARQGGISGYRIRSVSGDGAIHPSTEAAEYFPVYYTTETARIDVVYGLDLADSGVRQQPLEKARDGNMLAASQDFKLQSGTGDRFGFFVVLPIYKRGLSIDSVEDRRRNLVGFVQGVFQIDSMIAATLNGIQSSADYFVFSSQDAGARPIYARRLKPSAAPLDASRLGRFDKKIVWSGKITIADREWQMVAVPEPGSIVGHSRAWIILVAGECLTCVVFASMWRSNRHTYKLLRANEMIGELASTDPLTGLANRRAFHDRLATAFEHAKCGGEPFALFYIDLDGFKEFNDLMGHPSGDMLLQEVSNRLRALTVETDCVARFGGDEFVILQSITGAQEPSEVLAKKIVATLNGLSALDGHGALISASVGVSRFDAGMDGPDTLLMQADLALYRAKETGRNRACIYDGSFGQLASERVILGRELMAAVTGRNLALHYQPQVDIETGRIVGLEALVRWKHPQRGFISPADFIPLAEKTGSIVELGKWVFDEACRQTRLWQDEGIDVPSVAVNLSAIQCRRPELEQEIVASLTRWNVKPERIELELTESVLIEATQHYRDLIARLRALGLKLAIDDFGTGYSSLNYLTNFPVDRIKIAQELIFKCTTEIRCAAVVRAAIHLAEELDTESLAEGVETGEQAAFLSLAGCKFAQGYLFSRPVDAIQATALLRARIIRPLAVLPALGTAVAV
jgi:diguanylate cyclase (GGDEF)-like protein